MTQLFCILLFALLMLVSSCKQEEVAGGEQFPITLQEIERVEEEPTVYVRAGEVSGVRLAFNHGYTSYYHGERTGLKQITFLSPSEAVINGSRYYHVEKVDSALTFTRNADEGTVPRFVDAAWYGAYFSRQKTGEPDAYFLYSSPATRSTAVDSVFVGYGEYRHLEFRYHSFNLRYTEGNIIIANGNGSQDIRNALPGDKPGYFNGEALRYLDSNDTLIIVDRTLRFK